MADSQAMTESSGSAPPSPLEGGDSGREGSGTGGGLFDRLLPEGWRQRLEQLLGANPLRKLGLAVGLLAALGIGAGVFLWAQDTTELRTLYADLSSEDASAVINALEEQGVEVAFDERSGDIQVPEEQVHRARIFLASEGLPKGEGFGYEMLEEDPGFGVSESMEQARFDRALETELAKSIETLRGVTSARVHLDDPEESVFVRDRKEAKASVVLELDQERELPSSQVDGIIHLVASSVADLEHDNVSVVDHRGRLLTAEEEPSEATRSAQQLELTRRLEERLQRRVEDMIEPIVGPDRVRAQVSARLNFDERRQMEEFFDPEQSAIRSEQMSERSGGGSQWPMGIPGALTNQPPGPGSLDEDEDEDEGEGGGDGGVPFNSEETRNWEVGRSLNEVQPAMGVIERLTVGVLVDHRYVENEDGEVEREALPEDQIDTVENLVQDAVGYDADRGDAVSVDTVPFAEIVEPPEPPEELWEQDWVRDLIRLAVFAAIGLLIYLVAIRPIVNRMLGGGEEGPEGGAEAEAEGLEGRSAGEGGGFMEVGGAEESRSAMQLAGLSGEQLSDMRERPYEAKLQAVLELVENEPELAANAVKAWLDEDDKRKG
ncbi:MAG: flagellar basal-body MS-ring/collar protein FliF [Halorhodospira sp.]